MGELVVTGRVARARQEAADIAVQTANDGVWIGLRVDAESWYVDGVIGLGRRRGSMIATGPVDLRNWRLNGRIFYRFMDQKLKDNKLTTRRQRPRVCSLVVVSSVLLVFRPPML